MLLVMAFVHRNSVFYYCLNMSEITADFLKRSKLGVRKGSCRQFSSLMCNWSLMVTSILELYENMKKIYARDEIDENKS
jgi:hypothetical protein